MFAASVGVALSGERLQRYGLCGWHVKLGGPIAIEPYLSTLEMRFMTKRYTNQRSLLNSLLTETDGARPSQAQHQTEQFINDTPGCKTTLSTS